MCIVLCNMVLFKIKETFMKLTFLGAAREVTGSKHLITTKTGLKILLDCGMYQGKGLETDAMNRDLGFDPAEIDYLILSHAHIDHSGLIPYIYKLGFRGTVLCTPATRDLCAIMLADAGRIQVADVHTFNKKRKALGEEPVFDFAETDFSHRIVDNDICSFSRYVDDDDDVPYSDVYLFYCEEEPVEKAYFDITPVIPHWYLYVEHLE